MVQAGLVALLAGCGAPTAGPTPTAPESATANAVPATPIAAPRPTLQPTAASPTLAPTVAPPTAAAPTSPPTSTPAATSTPEPTGPYSTERPAPGVTRGAPNWPCAPGQVKGNRSSGIYHPPGGQFYAQTGANTVCFDGEAAAQAGGFRRSQR